MSQANKMKRCHADAVCGWAVVHLAPHKIGLLVPASESAALKTHFENRSIFAIKSHRYFVAYFFDVYDVYGSNRQIVAHFMDR